MAGVGQVKTTPCPKMGSPQLKQRRHLQLMFTQSGASSSIPPPLGGRNRRLIYERSCHKLNEKSSAGEIIDDPVASACRREGVPRGKKEGMAGKRQDWLQVGNEAA